MKKIRIVIADDHNILRQGVKSLLITETNDVDIVGEANSGDDLVKKTRELKPDLVLSDISMPGLSGIEATKIITSEFPDIKVIILSMHIDEDFIFSSIEAGAKGYIHKDAIWGELLEAVTEVLNGKEYYSKSISNKIIQSYLTTSSKPRQAEKESPSLTKREIEIIKLIAEGLINKEIADKLFISVRTVDSHKNNIKEKLGFRTNVDFVKYAIKNQLISID